MNKLLLLFLLVSLNIYAQIPPLLPPPMGTCDDNNDGFASFDLSSRIPMLLGGMDPTTTTISFHETSIGSETGTDAIVTPSAYVNIIPFSQRIYVRIVNTTNGDIFHPDFDIQTIFSPVAQPGELYFCDEMELAIYNLFDADAQITNGSTSVYVVYYATETDAQTNSNPIPTEGFIPTINPGQQILYARVFDPGGCQSQVTTLTLNTHNCTCPPPAVLSASNITDTHFTITFAPAAISTIMFVCLVPQGGVPHESNSVAVSVIGGMPSVMNFASLTSGICYSVFAKVSCANTNAIFSPWSDAFNICLPNCSNSGDCDESLILHAFVDDNNNGIKDSGELDFDAGSFVYQLNDSTVNQYGISNNGSYYIFDSNPANSYDLSFVVNNDLSAYYTSSVIHNNVMLPAGSGPNHLYFPVINVQPHKDIQVSLNPSGQPRPGFLYTNIIAYKNNSVQTIANGTLTFTKGSNVTVASVSEAGATLTASGFTYSFVTLAPFETRYINVSLLVPTIPTVALGDLITNSVTIEIDNDTNTSNNAATLTQAIVGSYDPNDKIESHGGKIVHSNFTANDYLYYTIQFENTGTAAAEFIRVEDLLDADLDETSFEMISASHPVNTKRDGNQLTWHFYDVNLPPTSLNPTGSHGYINFRIKPKAGYAIGDIIPNFASIYFDYNPPIVTETFNTEFVQSMGISTFSNNSVSVYPNPATDVVTITNSSGGEISKVAIYDILGKKIYTLPNSLPIITIDVSRFAKGMYLIELSSGSNTKVIKKLILK